MTLLRYFKEVYKYKTFLLYFTYSNFKGTYANTRLGGLWGFITPFTSALSFTIIGTIYNAPDSVFNHFVFTISGILPFTLFSNTFKNSAQIYLKNIRLIKRVRFPRIILILSNLSLTFFNFLIGFVVLVLLNWIKGSGFDFSILLIPILVFFTIISSMGAGMLLIKPTIYFRDLNYIIGYLTHALMFASPVLYNSSNIPSKWIWIYSLNPLVGVIEGFRAVLNHTQIPWIYILKGGIVSFTIFFVGLFVFIRNEYKMNDYL